MHPRTLALALALVTALIGTAAPPAFAQEDPPPSPSPSAEATIGEADDLALVGAIALPDEVAVDPTAGLGADLLDPTGSPDSEAAIAALGGWSVMLLPGLVELAGDDPELLALLEAMGSADALEAELLADIAAEVERATGADEPQEAASGGKKSRDRERDTEGATAFGLLAATRGADARVLGAPAADGAGASDGDNGGLSGQRAANLATAFGFVKDGESGEYRQGAAGLQRLAGQGWLDRQPDDRFRWRGPGYHRRHRGREGRPEGERQPALPRHGQLLSRRRRHREDGVQGPA